MSQRGIPWGLVLASLLSSYVLAVLPLPEWAAPMRPYWTAVVLVYWCLETPDGIGIGTGWLAGLGLDLMTGGLLGEHALRMTIITFIVHRFRRRLRFFPFWQQTLAVLVLLVNDRIVVLWIQGVMGYPWPEWTFWLAPLAGMLAWPVVFLLIDAARRRARAA